MAEPKASHGERLEDNVQRANRHRTQAHRGIGDEGSVRRECRCEHARRRAANTIEREAELSLTKSRFDLFRYLGRINNDNVSANLLKLGHQLPPPHDVDSL